MEHPIYLSAFVAIVIGASLSDPHASVSSLHTCVCMFACLLGPTTYRELNECLQIFHEDQHHHLEACEGLTVRVQHQRLE